ncbi:hypothetical protein V1511DRAFT_513068 [Dipodascopsis uninucleata]
MDHCASIPLPLTRRHLSDSDVNLIPMALQPGPILGPKFSKAPRSYSPASLDMYHLHSTSNTGQSSAIPSSTRTSTSSASGSSTVASSPTSTTSYYSSAPLLPPISSILPRDIVSGSLSSSTASSHQSSVSFLKDRSQSWSIQSSFSPTSGPSTPGAINSIPHSPASSTIASLASSSTGPSSIGSPYSSTSDLATSTASPVTSQLDLRMAHESHGHTLPYSHQYHKGGSPTSPGMHVMNVPVSSISTPSPTLPALSSTLTTPTTKSTSNSYVKSSPSTHQNYYPYNYPISSATTPPAVSSSSSTTSSATSTPQPLDRYVCPVCSRAFSRPSSLRIHSHSHTGEKPFVCSHAGCGKAFSVRSNMKRHERGCHAM